MLELVTMDKITFMAPIVKTYDVDANYWRLDALIVLARPHGGGSSDFFSSRYFPLKLDQELK